MCGPRCSARNTAKEKCRELFSRHLAMMIVKLLCYGHHHTGPTMMHPRVPQSPGRLS